MFPVILAFMAANIAGTIIGIHNVITTPVPIKPEPIKLEPIEPDTMWVLINYVISVVIAVGIAVCHIAVWNICSTHSSMFYAQQHDDADSDDSFGYLRAASVRSNGSFGYRGDSDDANMSVSSFEEFDGDVAGLSVSSFEEVGGPFFGFGVTEVSDGSEITFLIARAKQAAEAAEAKAIDDAEADRKAAKKARKVAEAVAKKAIDDAEADRKAAKKAKKVADDAEAAKKAKKVADDAEAAGSCFGSNEYEPSAFEGWEGDVNNQSSPSFGFWEGGDAGPASSVSSAKLKYPKYPPISIPKNWEGGDAGPASSVSSAKPKKLKHPPIPRPKKFFQCPR
jgi:hypothetical protein